MKIPGPNNVSVRFIRYNVHSKRPARSSHPYLANIGQAEHLHPPIHPIHPPCPRYAAIVYFIEVLTYLM